MAKRYRPPGHGPAMFVYILLIPFTWPMFLVPWLLKRALGHERSKLLPDWQVTAIILIVMVANFIILERVRHLWA